MSQNPERSGSAMSGFMNTLCPAEVDGTHVRMLYVEDDSIGAGIVKRNLERRPGFSVELAANGQLGLQMATGGTYDVLLVDHDMPEMGGLELVRELRARGSKVPAIMITGAGDEKTAINAIKSGCKDYIVKDVDGSFLHLLPAVVDQVLKQERAEEMLDQKNRENQRLLADLLETNKRLKRLNEIKNEVLGIAAHDLRSPITAIVAAITCLISDEEEATSRRYSLLEMCRSSSTQALNIIDELLDPARLTSGEIEIRPELLNLAEIIQEVIKLNYANAERKQIQIDFSPDPHVAALVDPFRSRELADNLLSNAIKYSPVGSTVAVGIYHSAGRACISIKDQGPGFTEEDRQHLYKRFYRLSARPTANESSTGLGLSIVKKIADLHQAEIQLNSVPGGGSEFIVAFPGKSPG